MATLKQTKLGGRPKAIIHQLYSRVAGSKDNAPWYKCIGCEEELPGKQLHKLCDHSNGCSSLTSDQKKLAAKATQEHLNKRLQKELQEEGPPSEGASETFVG
jgi:hypothetical protein